jgi:hypothetical protein
MHTIFQFLSQAAHQAPSADNSQPWQLSWHNQSITVSYDALRVSQKTFPADNLATLLTMGAVLENISQAASAAELTFTSHMPLLVNPIQSVYFQLVFEPITKETTVSLETLPLFKRHTNRFPYQSKVLPETLLTVLKNLTVGSARVQVIEQRPVIKAVGKLVRLASEMRFQTQEVHEWLAKSLRFKVKNTDVYGEGLDVASIDLPIVGRLFLRWISSWRRMKWLNKLGAYKAMALLDAQPVKKTPALVAIIGSGQFADRLAAGQLMNKVWITLNEQGIAVQPYYVLADQLQRRQANQIPMSLVSQADELYVQTKQLFQLGDGEEIVMLFRIGYPTRTPVKSKRLPLDKVCSKISV